MAGFDAGRTREEERGGAGGKEIKEERGEREREREREREAYVAAVWLPYLTEAALN